MSDFLTSNELYHHGILGQKWGVKNGPPYPLKGSVIQNGHWHVSKKGERNYNIAKGTVAQTLSYDKNRTKDTDMYFAALSRADKDFYNAVFNKKIPNDEKDENGKRIGPAYYLKYAIKNQAKSDIKTANEKDGAKAFMNLMRSSRDFSNYVLDEKRMSTMIDERRSGFRGYKESLESIKRMRDNPDKIDPQDAAKAYRLFNYAIPNESPDATRQRARFFKELKKRRLWCSFRH